MRDDYSTYVLIVDDDVDIRLLLREVLEEEEYRVVEAADGIEAWSVLRASDAPAIVIIDHNMPWLDGPGLMRRIAADATMAARTAVIYSTAALHGAGPHSVERGVQQLLDTLSASILWKPFDVDTLVRAVADAALRLSGHGTEDTAAEASYR